MIKKIERKITPQEAVEVTDKHVSFSGIKLDKNAKPGPRTPRQNEFTDFSIDEASLDLMVRLAKAIRMNEPIYLEGEQALGKSRTIEYMAMLCNKEVYRMSLNGQTDTSDMIGKWVPRTQGLRDKINNLLRYPDKCTDDRSKKLIETTIAKRAGKDIENIDPERAKPLNVLSKEDMIQIADWEGISVEDSDWVWQNGMLPEAIINNGWLIFDEITTVEPQILVRGNSVLEQNGKLILDENAGKIIEKSKHPGFRFFATGNPPGHRFKGRVPLSAEYLSRWTYQKIDKIKAKTMAQRANSRWGVKKDKKISTIERQYKPKAVLTGHEMIEIFEENWLDDLDNKTALFIEKLAELAEKGEIGGEQLQKFDYDYRDFVRFQSYIENMLEKNNMKQVINEAVEYLFVNKCEDKKDREKIRTLAKSLIKIQEPKWLLDDATDEQKSIHELKVRLLLREDIPQDIKDSLAQMPQFSSLKPGSPSPEPSPGRKISSPDILPAGQWSPEQTQEAIELIGQIKNASTTKDKLDLLKQFEQLADRIQAEKKEALAQATQIIPPKSFRVRLPKALKCLSTSLNKSPTGTTSTRNTTSKTPMVTSAPFPTPFASLLINSNKPDKTLNASASTPSSSSLPISKPVISSTTTPSLLTPRTKANPPRTSATSTPTSPPTSSMPLPLPPKLSSSKTPPMSIRTVTGILTTKNFPKSSPKRKN